MRIIQPFIVAAIASLGLAGTAAGQGQASIRINEVLANNASLADGGFVSDWVELYNPTASAVSLTGATLSDGGATPYVFPAGVSIPAGGYLLMYCNSLTPASTTNTGFGLKANGGLVTYVAANGAEDSVSYGIQAADFSIGRVPNGTGNWVLNTPTPRAGNVSVPLDPPNQLRVNEWMADARSGSDYFELYNPGPRPVALGGLGLTDTLTLANKFVISPLSFIGVGPVGGYTLFFAANGTDANFTQFGLSNNGESVGLFNGNNQIDAVTFGPQLRGVSQGRLPDGSANIVSFTFSPTPGAPNRDLGSLTNIVINELLAHTDPPLEDAIEFRNVTGQPVNMKGWYFRAKEANDNSLKTYVFPGDFIVPANGYRVLYEYQFAALDGLRFNSAHGGDITLYSVDADGSVIGFVKRSYDPSENGVSFGYIETSEGADWVALSPRSFGVDRPTSQAAFRRGNGLPNLGAKVGPIVINEIHYHPPDIISGGTTNDNTLDEFIELRNISGIEFPLHDPTLYRATKAYTVNGEYIPAGSVYADGRTNTWRLRGDVEFNFPPGIKLSPSELLLLVNFDPTTNAQQLAAFKLRFPSIPAGTKILGPYTEGSLENGGGSIELKRPDIPQGPQHTKDFRHVPYIVADKVKYKDAAPWPPEADGAGPSLQRRSSYRYGSEPLNWKAEPPTPGVRNTDPVTLLSTPQSVAFIAGNDIAFAVEASGTAPIRYQWSHNGTNLPGATNAILPLENLQLSQVGRYFVTVSNDESTLTAEAALRVDSVKPVLTVTSPKPNIRWSNDVITVQGTVRDDFGVAEVLVRLNGGEFLPANGTTNWSLALSLAAGTNVIQITAVDLGNNRSPTNTLRVFRVWPSLLTVNINGGGSVAPALGGQMLEVGRRFTLTATPFTGQLFSNWTGGLVSTANPLNFPMQSNLVLEANFVPNPFIAARGVYNGLFFNEAAPAHGNAGFFTATVTEPGGYTASIQYGAKKSSFSGRFDLNGTATNRASLGGTNALIVELRIDLAGDLRRIRGRVLGAGWEATLLAEPAGFPPANPTTLAGSYTLNFRSQDLPGEPAGDGYATATLSPVGLIGLGGTLADTTKLSQKVALTRARNWPLYASLYGGKGSIVGWLQFDDDAPVNGIFGDVLWTKPALPTAKLHRDAFVMTAAAVGSRYTVPTAGSRILELTNAVVEFSGGNLAAPVSFAIELTPANKVINLPATNKLTLTFTPGTGLMGGSFVDPSSGRTIPFKGALLENIRSGGGSFAGTNESGRVRLVP